VCEVPFIACQRMNSKDGAARIFARAFFTELRRSNDIPHAYGMARDAVERRTGQLASVERAAVRAVPSAQDCAGTAGGCGHPRAADGGRGGDVSGFV